MKSDSSFKASPLVEIENVHLTFKTSMHGAHSLRDEFIQILKNPVQALVRNRDQAHVLRGINLKIFKGDYIAVLGRNGAGKTTLARCLAGVYIPLMGHIQSTGKVRAIFDTSVGIYPELSGRENVKILTRFLYPNHKLEYTEMVQEIIEFSGLGVKADLPFRTYSNGMQARLGLALVTARPSDLIILDEVFDGADRFFREKMGQRLRGFLSKAQAVIFISHSLEQMREICNRAIVVEDGLIVFDGELESGIKFYEELGSREVLTADL